jgi:hypothetical protein
MVGRVEIDQVEKGMMATGRMGGAVGGRGGGSREGTLAGGEIFMSGNEKDFWVRTPYSWGPRNLEVWTVKIGWLKRGGKIFRTVSRWSLKRLRLHC